MTGDRTPGLCGATQTFRVGTWTRHHGPCDLDHDHDGPVHTNPDGTRWVIGWSDPVKAEDRTPLRERLARAMAHAPGTVYQACNDDMYLRIADAVLPVVEAEAAVERSRAALATFDGRGVNNFDVPTAREVLDAWRASLGADRTISQQETVPPERAEVSDDPTAANYSGYLQRAENAEDRLRKAEQAYTQLAAVADDAVAARDRWRARAEEVEAAAEPKEIP